MPVGDVNIKSLSIGGLDLTNPDICHYYGINVYEDLFNPYGPTATIYVNDYIDALSKYNIDGKQPISIGFSTELGGSVSFDLMSYENLNLNDGSITAQRAMKSKQYEIRGISPEYLNAQGNSNIQKSYPEIPVSSIMQDLVKITGFVSTKGFFCDDPTRTRSYRAQGHTIKVYQELIDLSVSIANKSSAYVLFVTGGRYRYCTLEQLCMQGAVANLKQTTTLSASSTEQERLNSIQSILVDTSFFTAPRVKLKTKVATYDPVTGKATFPFIFPVSGFKHLGRPYAVPAGNSMYNQLEITGHDRVNNQNPTGLADARANRAAYLAHFAQNSASLTIPGNPRIKLGDVINITIPNKSTLNQGTENQFNGPVLVTAINHDIGPLGTQLRYKMGLKVTKAGGFD
jgi:hypothetical protein